MTDQKPPPPNPNATIQLDAASAADVVLESSPQLPQAERSDGGTVRRATPPPLPPTVSQPPTRSVAPEAPAKNRNLIYGVAFVVLLALVIGLGVKVGGSLRPPSPPAPTTSAVASASAAPTTTPTTTQTIVIKTIEMNDQPDGG